MSPDPENQTAPSGKLGAAMNVWEAGAEALALHSDTDAGGASVKPTPKPLPKVLRFQGDILTQRKRIGNVALYDRGESVIEVILIRLRGDRMIRGKQIASSEAYPSNSDFGRTGWCYSDPDKAIRERKAKAMFQQLVEREQDRLKARERSQITAISSPTRT